MEEEEETVYEMCRVPLSNQHRERSVESPSKVMMTMLLLLLMMMMMVIADDPSGHLGD